MAALSVVILFMTGLIPTATIALPGLAGCCLIPVVAELGLSWGFGTYAVCSVLALFLAPDREAALIYILLLGYYPVLYGQLAKIKKKPLRIAVKLLLLNLTAALEISASVWLLHIPLEGGWVFLLLYWLVLNAVFLVYDLALRRVIDFYYACVRRKLLRMIRSH